MKYLILSLLFFAFVNFSGCEKVSTKEMAFRPEYIPEGNYISPTGENVTISYVVGQKSHLRITKETEAGIEKQIEIVYTNIGTSYDCTFYCYNYGSGFEMKQYGGFITLHQSSFIFDCTETIDQGFMLLPQQHNEFLLQ